jgi:hypothetical protein
MNNALSSEFFPVLQETNLFANLLHFGPLFANLLHFSSPPIPSAAVRRCLPLSPLRWSSTAARVSPLEEPQLGVIIQTNRSLLPDTA